MKRIDKYEITSAELMPSIVVFSVDNATAVFCQSAFEQYLTPKTPYRVLYMNQSLDSLRFFPHALAKPVLLLVEEELEPSSEEKFLTVLKRQSCFKDVPYIIIRYTDEEVVPEGVPAPAAFVDIRKDKVNLLMAIGKILRIRRKDAEKWQRSLYK